MIRYGFPLIALAVGACATATQPAPKTCDAAPGQGFVGQKLSDKLQSDAQKSTGSGSVRVIRPGQAVTMDFRSDRLNIEVDDKETVTRITCG